MNVRRLAAGLFVAVSFVSIGCAHNYNERQSFFSSNRQCCPPASYATPALNTVPPPPVPVTSGFAPAPVNPGCCR